MEVLPPEDQLSKHQFWKGSSGSSGDCYLGRSISAPKTGRSSPPQNPQKQRRPNKQNLGQPQQGKARSKKASPNSRVSEARDLPKQKVTFVIKNHQERSLAERSNFGKAEEVVPRVTILQRPSSKEAAMVDLAKITGLPLSEVYAKNGLPAPEKRGNMPERRNGTDVAPGKGLRRKANSDVVVVDRKEVEEVLVEVRNSSSANSNPKEGVVRTIKAHNLQNQNPDVVQQSLVKKKNQVVEVLKKRNHVKLVESKLQTSKVHQQIKVQEAATSSQKLPRPSPEAPQGQEQKHESQVYPSPLRMSRSLSASFLTKTFGDTFMPPLLFDEKWAGPAFTNSPPPSSLPIPNSRLMRPSAPPSAACKATPAAMLEATAGSKTSEAELVLRRILNLG